MAERVDNELGFRQSEQQVSHSWRDVGQVPGNGSPEHWKQMTVTSHIGGTLPLSSMHKWIAKQGLQLLENLSKINSSMGIFWSFNGAYIKDKQAFL